jgi:hypothetical protein
MVEAAAAQEVAMVEAAAAQEVAMVEAAAAQEVMTQSLIKTPIVYL